LDRTARRQQTFEVRRTRRRSRNKTEPDRAGDRGGKILLIVGALVAVAGTSFTLGAFTGGSVSNPFDAGPAAGRSFDLSAFRGLQGAGATAVAGDGGAISGTVQSIDGNSMVVQLADGSTVTIDMTGSPTYHGEGTSSPSPVSPGQAVVVQLDPNASADPNLTNGSSTTVLRAKDIIVMDH
jgi:hypothetical protein